MSREHPVKLLLKGFLSYVTYYSQLAENTHDSTAIVVPLKQAKGDLRVTSFLKDVLNYPC